MRSFDHGARASKPQDGESLGLSSELFRGSNPRTALSVSPEFVASAEIGLRLAGLGVAEVNVEIHESLIFFEGDEIGNVEASVGEQVKLILQIEVE